MKTFLIAAGVFAVATPAIAQTTGTTSGTTTPPATTADSSTGTSTTDSTMSSAAPSSTAPAAAAPADPKQIIATEFPTYDKDGNGALSTSEFDGWMLALKEKSGSPAMKPTEQTTWLKGAFTTADKDKSKSVSMTELTTYLTAAG